jgi:hypothetical protein
LPFCSFLRKPQCLSHFSFKFLKRSPKVPSFPLSSPFSRNFL